MSTRMIPSLSRTARDEQAVPARDQTNLVAALHLAVAELVAEPLQVRSLRRKPGRGLVAVYSTARTQPPNATLVTATVAEEAMSSPKFPPYLAGLEPKAWQGQWPGVVYSPVPGVRVQAFPADADLPALVAAVDLTAGSPLHRALSEAAVALTDEPDTEVVSAEAEVVRYRPGSRCVLRYRVTTRSAAAHAGGGRRHVLFGKFYRRPEAALSAHGLAERLWQVTPPDGPAYLPRPLRVVPELGLVLSEAAGGAEARATIPGRTLLNPAALAAAEDALRTAAEALAWWHCADVDPGPGAARTAATESRRAKARVELLATAVPGLEMLHRMGDELLTALARAHCERLRLVHGAFRPNQLVFTDPSRAAITDLDGAGAGDPAVDIGDFCAHLRPAGWYGRPDQRAWSATACDTFRDHYREAMIGAGVAPAEISATLRRATLFEVSSILKIAGHRSRRLSSGRPGEVIAMLTEAADCLARYDSGQGGLR